MRIETLAGGANSLPRVSRLLASMRSFLFNSNRYHLARKKTQMSISMMGFNYNLDTHIHLVIKYKN